MLNAEESNVPLMNVDNSWNVEGLIAARTDGDGELVNCSATETPIFYLKADGRKVSLITHGECCNCAGLFAEKHLMIAEGVSSPGYPVIYIGLMCKDCNKLPEHEWKFVEENKK